MTEKEHEMQTEKLTHQELFATLKEMGQPQLQAVLRFRFQLQMLGHAGKDISWVLNATDKDIVESIVPEYGGNRDDCWEAVYFYMGQTGMISW